MQTAEFLDGCSYQRPDLFRIGDIGTPKQSISAQRCRQSFTPVLFDVGNDDPRALGDKPLHRASPDAGSAAGHDGDFAG
jgi:hypothetical protein